MSLKRGVRNVLRSTLQQLISVIMDPLNLKSFDIGHVK